MICAKWMKSAKFAPVQLLKLMEVASNEEECETTLKVVLEAARSGDETYFEGLSDPEIRAFRKSATAGLVLLSTADDVVDAEALFFSRIACATAMESSDLSAAQKEDVLNKVAPDIPSLCEIFQKNTIKLIQSIVDEEPEQEEQLCFLCLQLLGIAKATGLQEEGSRRHFSSVMQNMLSSYETPDDLIEGCVQAMRVAHESEDDFLQQIHSIVTDLSGGNTGGDEEIDEARLVRILSILTIVFENCSNQMASSTLLDDFGAMVSPAVSHSNVLVREAGISCFGKLGIFSNGETVVTEYNPILLSVACNEEEKMEIRGQAMLALSDWSMLYPAVLDPVEIEGETVSFVDLIKQMMAHSSTGVASIAAEITAKLLFAGRVCDSTLVAHLLVLFFDPAMEKAASKEGSDVKEVGSAVRLQQMLSLFFPAYAIKSEAGRDSMTNAISIFLKLIQDRPKTKKRRASMPLVKMVEFVCATVDAGKKASSKLEQEQVEESSPKDEDEDDVESSTDTALDASLQVAAFLAQEGTNLSTTNARALSKLLGGFDIDTETGNNAKLVQLKDQMEELGMVLTDRVGLQALDDLNDLLADVVEEEDEDEDPSTRNDDSDATETEDEDDGQDENASVENNLMNSMVNLSVTEKENSTRRSSATKAGNSRKSGVSVASTSSSVLGDIVN